MSVQSGNGSALTKGNKQAGAREMMTWCSDVTTGSLLVGICRADWAGQEKSLMGVMGTEVSLY